MRDAREVSAVVSRSMCLSFTDEFALIDLRYEPVFREKLQRRYRHAVKFYEIIRLLMFHRSFFFPFNDSLLRLMNPDRKKIRFRL